MFYTPTAYDQMDGLEIPPYFICPISLQIMEDPVTVATGVSYDRASIERWLTVYGRDKCPVTNQTLVDRTLTPNSTLLRLIQSWAACAAQLPAAATARSNPLFDLSDVLRQLRDTDAELQRRGLKKVKLLAEDDGDFDSMACMEKAGVTSLVASLIVMRNTDLVQDALDVIDEATIVLQHLKPSPQAIKRLAESNNGELIRSLSSILQRGSYRARTHATLLLKSIFKVVDEGYKSNPPPDLFDGVVEILKDQNSARSTNLAALSILTEVLVLGRNRAKAVEAGLVAVIIELLIEENGDRRSCEAMLYILELACGRAEGRAAVVGHRAGWRRWWGRVAEEMAEVGGVAKLCMVVQVEGSRRSREIAKEILGMHLRTWSRSPCFPYSYSLPY
uniref:U-box domain-containing protein n=1 Tax=Ananas comosus var. bracteatus TaxID=296719 RepID=A0A6V7NSE0_ANACO|nr:unnamed protein product [Ananas comosus var. bracteatus]